MKRRALIRIRDSDGSVRGVLVKVPSGALEVDHGSVARAIRDALDPVKRGPIRLCEDDDGRVTHF